MLNILFKVTNKSILFMINRLTLSKYYFNTHLKCAIFLDFF